MRGISLRANSTSTTAPMHWTILPSAPPARACVAALMVSILFSISDSGGAADDFRQFLRDRRLPVLVVDQRELVNHRLRIVRRGLHCDHARGLLGGQVLGQRLIDDLLD